MVDWGAGTEGIALEEHPRLRRRPCPDANSGWPPEPLVSERGRVN